MRKPAIVSAKKRQIVVVGLTLREARLVIALLEACDDASDEIFRSAKSIARRLIIADARARSLLK